MNKRAHENVVRSALGDGRMNPKALDWIVRANLNSDFIQWRPEKHFDNASCPEVLADRWKQGLHAYFEQAIAVASPGKTNRRRSLSSFGRASHALADFYAHTDWVEIHVNLGEADRLAPFTGSVFSIHLLPPQLSSGFFSLRFGLDGCPCKDGVYIPPPPHIHCHAAIAKDDPDKGHGAELSPEGRTYFEIAQSLAIRATLALWEEFQTRLTQTYGPEVCRLLAWGPKTT